MKCILLAALTADGFIAHTSDQPSTDWTSHEDKQHFRQATKAAGVIVMGSRTFATIGHGLSGRLTVIYTSKPQIYRNLPGVETTDEAPAVLLERLQAKGYEQVAICGGAQIYQHFMQAAVIDELWLTIEPVLFGTGVALFNDHLDTKLELIESKSLNHNTLFHKYTVLHDRK